MKPLLLLALLYVPAHISAQHLRTPMPIPKAGYSDWHLSKEISPFEHPSTIVAPYSEAPILPVTITGKYQVDLLAGETVNLQPGFSATNFSNLGYFHAAIQEPELKLALYGEYDYSGSLMYIPRDHRVEIGIRLPDTVFNAVEAFVNNTPGLKLNPYNPEQIDIKAEFFRFNETANQWYNPYLRHGFYYNEYNRLTNSWEKDTTSYTFRVRFVPEDYGNWKCRVTATVAGFGTYSREFHFKCGPLGGVPEGKGYLTVGSGKRYLTYARTGETFLPIGQNLSTPTACDQCGGNCENCHGSDMEFWYQEGARPIAYTTYLDEMEKLADAGANYFRLLIGPQALDIEFEKLNDYSARLHRAWEMDRILDKARELDLKIHLNLSFHYVLENPSYYDMLIWDWQPNSCDGQHGWDDPGYCYAHIPGVNGPLDFFTHPDAIKNYKHRLRYMIARWGYSQNIGIIELFSEINNAGTEPGQEFVPPNTCRSIIIPTPPKPYEQSVQVRANIQGWQIEMGRYIKEDLKHTAHPFTVSYAGTPWENTFASPYIDVMTYNWYARVPTKYEWQRSEIESYLALYNKPLIYSEIGSPGTERCDDNAEWIKSVWITPFTGLSTALNWGNAHHWSLWPHFGRVRNFLEGIDLNGEGWEPVYDRTANKKIELFGLKNSSERKVTGVIVNRTFNYWTNNTIPNSECVDTSSGRRPEPEYQTAQGFDLSRELWFNVPTLQNMGFLRWYVIQYFNIYTGQLMAAELKRSNFNGNLQLTYPRVLGAMNEPFNPPVVAFRVYPEGGSFMVPITEEGGERVTLREQQQPTEAAARSQEENQLFSLYPNPATEECIIELGDWALNGTLAVLNSTGASVLEKRLETLTFSLNTTSLAPGFYLIKVTSPKASHIKRLIIQ